MLHKLGNEIKEWVECYIQNLPGSIGKKIRRLYWKRKFRQCSCFSMDPECTIKGAENITIGNNVSVFSRCFLYAHNNGSIKIDDRTAMNSNVMLGASENGEILIGKDVLVGPNVVMRASNHRYARGDVPINQQGHEAGKIVIEDDVWIGANVVILPDAVIRKGSVIGAGAVVRGEIPGNVFAAGIPAKVVKENIRREEIKERVQQ